MKGRCYLVSGAVQGVGYRWFVARHARQLGLCGHAQNLADGHVEVVAAGAEEALDMLEARLRAGPAHAAVKEVVLVDRIVEVDCPGAFDVR